MNTIIRENTIELKEDIIKFVKLVADTNKWAIKALKNKDIQLAAETVDVFHEANEMAQDLIDDTMFALTQNPLAKELRRIIAYQSISRILVKVVKDTIKIAKFTLIRKESVGESAIKRINKIDKVFVEMLKILSEELALPSRKRKELKEIAFKYKEAKKQVNSVRNEIIKSMFASDNLLKIEERMFTLSICEAMQRNCEKVTYIYEQLLFITDGKNHSLL